MLARTAHRSRNACGRSWFGVFLISGYLLLAGCTREFFREKADTEVEALLAKKDADERWPLINYWVYPHPLSRFADADSPDKPAMPPDDPAAWFTAPKPQKPSRVGFNEGTGYLEMLAQFDALNRAEEAEITEQTANEKQSQDEKLEQRGRRPYRINLEQALELALINSREFQVQRENLYLAALTVSNERFNFLPQFLAAQEAIRQWSAEESTIGPTNQWQLNNAAGLSWNFATGAALLLRLANQIVFDVSSRNGPTISTSSLVLDISQPLLRGGGQAVALEPLTQAERDLLYEVRRFARFNKEFFVQVAGGQGSGAPGGAPNLLPGATITLNGGVVRGISPIVGYLPTVQRKLNIELQQRNVDELAELLQFYREFAKGGGLSPLQVDQVEQQLLDARTQLLAQEVIYLDSIEQFKIQLGLPTDLPLELDLNVLEELREQLFRFQKLELNARKIGEEFTKLEEREDGSGALRERMLDLIASAPLTKGTEFARLFPARLERWNVLNSGVMEKSTLAAAHVSAAGLLPALNGGGAFASITFNSIPFLQQQQMLRDYLIDVREDLIDAELEVPPELDDQILLARREFEIGALDELLTTYKARPWLVEENERQRQSIQDALFRQIESRFSLVFDEARAERTIEFNKLWPELPPTRLHGQDLLQLNLDEAHDLVGQTALFSRLDLMNQQAQLVDSWRRVAVFANSLLGTFDVRYNATMLAPPPGVIGQGMNFDGNNTRHQIIFNTELPLVRRIERNNYRASLIAYQRQRRNLQSIQDFILLQVRARVRRLQQLEATYKIQQRALLLIYSQVNQSREQLQAPAEPGVNRDTAAAAGTATLQLLQAQRGVPQAQNNLYSTWINYLIARMELYRDLELMQIDSRGVWIDDQSRQPIPRAP
ncbi:MAG TPA: hypothetical protein PKA06_00630 [Gemmatales bacterium]|nr:hypothetical protein [Gemmatales bacterium]